MVRSRDVGNGQDNVAVCSHSSTRTKADTVMALRSSSSLSCGGRVTSVGRPGRHPPARGEETCAVMAAERHGSLVYFGSDDEVMGFYPHLTALENEETDIFDGTSTFLRRT